ncbi:L-cysteine lyase [Steroidobacter denitrificans]|uniref:L-cysteine lyase n=1 Tax=Steroidobacter denitrificans TaxID=465721 RepID=A0A127F5E4_STEDE|nr:aminotransferase class V-fold PLP-dependent enzyme [Steroidobacter denitrificans]AMN45662.1 L-cysteine lyase [Steroidobacter denitrificans]
MNDTKAPPPQSTGPTGMTRRELLTAGTLLAASAPAFGQSRLPGMPSSSRELWQWVRTQGMFDSRLTFLDVATAGPTLRAAMAAEYRAREAQSFGVANAALDRWATETTRLARRFADFMGCSMDELIFTRGTGEALSIAAAGLDLASGDEVVTTTREHPAALSPWLMLARRHGIVVKQITLPAPLETPEQTLEVLGDAMSERTRVLAFPHLDYADGALLPVRQICALARSRNVITIVDGAQALGMLDFQLHDLDCDFYAASFHKWMNGSHGTGMLYVSRPSLERLWPIEPRGIDAPPIPTPTVAVGQHGVPAALHKLGNIVPLAWPALRGAEIAVDFQQQILRSRIEARVRELAIYARMRLQTLPGVELLTPARPGLWAGILSFQVPGRSAADMAAHLAHGFRIYIREVHRAERTDGALRVSLHIFNSHDDIEKLIQGLQQVLR